MLNIATDTDFGFGSRRILVSFSTTKNQRYKLLSLAKFSRK